MHPSQRGQPGPSRSHSSNSQPYLQTNHYDNSLGARAAYALTSALADPYGQARASYYSYINQNYAQAYFNQMLQQQQQMPRTTEEGYTLSSTYNPSQEPASSSTTSSANRASSSRHDLPSRAPTRTQQSYHPNKQQHYPQAHPSHHRPPAPGDIKCTYPGCSFSGSKHTVEIHRMDRHLIYPPGWKKRTDNWDADPSLKGKPIPILGTGLVLDTPESIDAWIAERKKRWPSKQNVEEKKKREEEAIQRGEINPSDLSRLTAKGTKKRRLGNNEERSQRENHHHRSSTFSQSHKRAKTAVDANNDNDNGDGNQPQCLESTLVSGTSRAEKEVAPSSTASGSDNPTNPAADNRVNSLPSSRVLATTSSSSFPQLNLEAPDEDDAEDDDGDSQSSSDVDPVRDAISSKRPDDTPEEYPSVAIVDEKDEMGQSTLQGHQLSVPRRTQAENTVSKSKKSHPQPKRPTRNPFASKSLLRNLLLPEIRNTVSNLSQAIHFLAENDFLVGVELKPGDADAQLIQVLDNKETS